MMSVLATQKPRMTPGGAETDGGTREQFLELPVVVAARWIETRFAWKR